jgi:desulfoferrodoxin-like iron-binding protein
MKILECGTCGHIEFNAAPGTCLICHAQGGFKDNPAAIKTPGQPGAGESEKKHIPSVVIEPEAGGDSVTVKVRVGDLEHPMKAEHHIRYIDFYLNSAFVSRIWLSPVLQRPVASVSLVAKSGTVTVLENCNVHGTWMTQKTF